MRGKKPSVLLGLALAFAVLWLQMPGLLGQPNAESRSAHTQGATSPDGGVVSGTLNPLQLGLLRWYAANQTTSFTVGNGPGGVAFDGASIWVANSVSNNVTKLQASDGTVLGTFPVGSAPYGLAFDGANIWVANTLSNNVTELRANDGAVLGTFTVGNGPVGVVFDGANVWVTNANSNSVTELRAKDGKVLGTFTAGNIPYWAAFDGANIWVANGGSGTVSKL